MHEDLKARMLQLERALAEHQAQDDLLGSMLEKSNNQAHTFYNISKVIASTNDLDAMIPVIIGYIRKSINFDRVTIYLADGNHRVFKERLHQEVSRRNRTEKPLSLIMLDIDHFRQFNDNYGHQEGDRILKELAGSSRASAVTRRWTCVSGTAGRSSRSSWRSSR